MCNALYKDHNVRTETQDHIWTYLMDFLIFQLKFIKKENIMGISLNQNDTHNEKAELLR